MKILFTPRLRKVDTPNTLFELLRGIAQCKPSHWELHLGTRRGLPAEFRSDAWRVHEVFPELKPRQEFASRARWAASRLRYNLSERRALRELLQAEPWDIVHFQEISPFFQRGLFRQGRGSTRFVHTVHNVQQHKRVTGLTAAHDRFTRAAWSRFDALVFHSDRLKQSAARELGAGHGRLEVIPHGIWSVSTNQTQSNVGLRPVRLVFLGVVRANKGLHLLLDAVAQHATVELVVAGAIIDQAYFAKEIAPRLARLKAAGTDITTEFAFIEKGRMIQYLQRADYLVLPYSDFESQSGMLMYAMACGVPVIASDVGALGETVRQHRVGRTYSVVEKDGLLQALRTASGAESESLRENVRRYARDHSWQAVAAKHCDLYRAMLARPLNRGAHCN